MLETSRIVIIPDSTEPVSAQTVTAGIDGNASGKIISLDVTPPMVRSMLFLPAWIRYFMDGYSIVIFVPLLRMRILLLFYQDQSQKCFRHWFLLLHTITNRLHAGWPK